MLIIIQNTYLDQIINIMFKQIQPQYADADMKVTKKILTIWLIVGTFLFSLTKVLLSNIPSNCDDSPKTLRRSMEADIDLSQQRREFDLYFNSKSTVIPPTIQLKTDYEPIEWPQFHNTLPLVEMTALFTTSLRQNYNLLNKTLASFFTFNTYPLKKVIIINDGPLTSELETVVKVFKNVTWIITNLKVGQLQSIDQAMKHVETDYYFTSEDDFQYVKPGFIQYSLQSLLYDPLLNGVSMGHSGYDRDYFFSIGPLFIITYQISYQYSGLSFWPSVRRLENYRSLEVGYNLATFNISYGRGAGICEPVLSMIYTMKNLHYGRSLYDFYLHLREIVNDNKVWNKQASQNPNYNSLLKDYRLWYSKKQQQTSRNQLGYLIKKVKYEQFPSIIKASDKLTKKTNQPATKSERCTQSSSEEIKKIEADIKELKKLTQFFDLAMLLGLLIIGVLVVIVCCKNKNNKKQIVSFYPGSESQRMSTK